MKLWTTLYHINPNIIRKLAFSLEFSLIYKGKHIHFTSHNIFLWYHYNKFANSIWEVCYELKSISGRLGQGSLQTDIQNWNLYFNILNCLVVRPWQLDKDVNQQCPTKFIHVVPLCIKDFHATFLILQEIYSPSTSSSWLTLFWHLQ